MCLFLEIIKSKSTNMEKDNAQKDRSPIFKLHGRSQRQSTSSASFPVTEQQQHRDSNSFMNPTLNNNKQSK